jgi:hypothetical protein
VEDEVKYFLEIMEDNQRYRAGHLQGYATLEEAVAEAKRRVDDALPHNTVRIMREVGYAALAGDGGEYVTLHEAKL